MLIDILINLYIDSWYNQSEVHLFFPRKKDIQTNIMFMHTHRQNVNMSSISPFTLYKLQRYLREWNLPSTHLEKI